jgi:hypothetical protein
MYVATLFYSYAQQQQLLCIFSANTLYTQIFNTNILRNIYIYCFRSHMYRERIFAIFRKLQDFATYTAYMATYYTEVLC